MKRTVEANFLPLMIDLIEAGPRILIVDDHRDFTRSAKVALERTRRYSVCEENNARAAHQTAQLFKPDLILLDIDMPGIDGGEVAARMRSDPALHGVPIVFLTALLTKAEEKSGLRIEGDAFLAKPITLAELIEGIEENLRAPRRCDGPKKNLSTPPVSPNGA